MYKDKKYLKEEYVVKHRSARQIGEDCNCNETTIRRWLRKHNIPVRTLSEALKGRTHSKEARRKLSEAHKGRVFTVEHKANLVKGLNGRKMPEDFGKRMSKLYKERVKKPEDAPAWQGGKSFEPYCSLFNNKKKEEIRNRDNRICQLCGKSEIHNGKRLAVHHIDSDKMQGCNGKKWELTALCCSCNGQKDTIEKEFLLVSRLMWRIRK